MTDKGTRDEGQVRSRDFRLDNVRCLLIFLVVFCHLLVQTGTRGPATNVLYQVINVFHMPAFVLLTGYFARFRPRRMVQGLLVPYVIFQLLASVRRNIVAGRAWLVGVTLLYPQWTLWYLPACLLWYCTIPALECVWARGRAACVTVSALAFAASFAAGFAPWLGEFLDLARVVAFYPFFCVGYFAGRGGLSAAIDRLDRRQTKVLCVVSTLALLAAMMLHYAHGACPVAVLRRDTPYGSMWDLEARVIMQLAATAWCVWLLAVMPNRKADLVSEVGRNTLSVYLLHPWLIRLLRHALPLPGGELTGIGICAVTAAGMLVLLGNDRVARAFRYVFACGWMDRQHAARS